MDPIEEVVQQLKELNNTQRKILELEGLEFALEPLRYIARKLRTGEALPSTASYYQLIAPAATFAITFTNPAGYVWIGIFQGIAVSQNGIFEFTAMVDDGLLPVMYIPRVTPYVINWNLALPFVHIIKDTTTIIYVNHDIANQWVSVISVGTYLRKEVWERDSKLMDEAAEKYIHPAPPMQLR